MDQPSPVAPSPLSVVLAAGLALAAAGPAAARELAIATTPDHATWEEAIVVTVSGIVETACGPEIVELARNQALSSSSTQVLDLDEAHCGVLAPSVPHPFSVAVELPPLIPAEHTVRVRDLVLGGHTDHRFVVHEVSPFALVVPDDARSGEGAVLELRGWGATCPQAELELVDGVLEGAFTSHCPILSPGPEVFVLEIPVGPLPAGVFPIHLLDFDNFVGGPIIGSTIPSLVRGTLRVWDASGCVPTPSDLCLGDGRFRVAVAWRDFAGGTGAGHAVRLPDRDDSGLFWFFDQANVELTVKVLDACGLNDRFWVFVSSGSTVEYTLTVTDTQTGVARPYRNELGEVPALLADTDAFATCRP
jgi:hypothetical protein